MHVIITEVLPLEGISADHCCSVAQLLLTLCDPMDYNMPCFPVLHYLSEFAQTQWTMLHVIYLFL